MKTKLFVLIMSATLLAPATTTPVNNAGNTSNTSASNTPVNISTSLPNASSKAGTTINDPIVDESCMIIVSENAQPVSVAVSNEATAPVETTKPVEAPKPVDAVENIKVSELVEATDTLDLIKAGTVSTTSEGYTDYYVTDFNFSKDGLSGEFELSTFNSFSPEEVQNFKVGDTLPDGSIISEIEFVESNAFVYTDQFCWWFRLQENGRYYMSNDFGEYSMTPVGKQAFAIDSNVVILDNTDPFSNEEIAPNGFNTAFENVAAFSHRLAQDDVWYIPDLFIRVKDGKVTHIVSNPLCHEPWYDEAARGYVCFE